MNIQLKFRTWDKTHKRFIYPILDISNDFYSKYPDTEFVFDRLIFEKDGVEFYQNDIVIVEYHESGRYKNKRLYLAVLTLENIVHRFDSYLFRFCNFEHLYLVPELMKYTAHYVNYDFEKVGNIHENFDLLVNEF